MFTNLMILLCCGFTIWSGQCQETGSIYKLYVKTLEKYNRVSDVLTLSSSPDAVQSRKEHFLGFVNTKNLVDRINSDISIPFTAELNIFSVMTKAEQDLYKGFSGNMSEMILAEASSLASEPVNLLSAPSSVDHSQKGQVPVKQQGSCGSCWAYSSISAIDFAYYKVTGDLFGFSEQELLDCVYNGQKDGCKGGFMDAAFNYVLRAGRLASEQDAPYQGKDHQGCSSGRWRNSLTKAKIVGHQTVRGDQQLLAAAAKNVVAVAMKCTDRFNVYRSGIFQDQTRIAKNTLDHAVSLVGYGNSNGQPFWKVRNSWGKSWGSGGYIYMCRNINNILGLSLVAFTPVFQCTGSCNRPDIDGDADIDINDNASCENVKNKEPDDFCNAHISFCSTPKETYFYYVMKKYCKKTCKICEGNDGDRQDNADGCPSGLKKCSDGMCRHAHMCH